MKKLFPQIYMAFFVFAILCVVATQAAADTVTYTYDNAGRLTKSDYGGGNNITYTYDKAGNLLSKVSVFQTAWVDFNYNGPKSGTQNQPSG